MSSSRPWSQGVSQVLEWQTHKQTIQQGAQRVRRRAAVPEAERTQSYRSGGDGAHKARRAVIRGRASGLSLKLGWKLARGREKGIQHRNKSRKQRKTFSRGASRTRRQGA